MDHSHVMYILSIPLAVLTAKVKVTAKSHKTTSYTKLTKTIVWRLIKHVLRYFLIEKFYPIRTDCESIDLNSHHDISSLSHDRY